MWLALYFYWTVLGVSYLWVWVVLRFVNLHIHNLCTFLRVVPQNLKRNDIKLLSLNIYICYIK